MKRWSRWLLCAHSLILLLISNIKTFFFYKVLSFQAVASPDAARTFQGSSSRFESPPLPKIPCSGCTQAWPLLGSAGVMRSAFFLEEMLRLSNNVRQLTAALDFGNSTCDFDGSLLGGGWLPLCQILVVVLCWETRVVLFLGLVGSPPP